MFKKKPKEVEPKEVDKYTWKWTPDLYDEDKFLVIVYYEGEEADTDYTYHKEYMESRAKGMIEDLMASKKRDARLDKYKLAEPTPPKNTHRQKAPSDNSSFLNTITLPEE